MIGHYGKTLAATVALATLAGLLGANAPASAQGRGYYDEDPYPRRRAPRYERDYDRAARPVRPSREWYEWQRKQEELNASGFRGCYRRPAFNNDGQVIGYFNQCQ